nr:MAG TPA: hypothetical protein [Caudoviricetes sp.]
MRYYFNSIRKNVKSTKENKIQKILEPVGDILTGSIGLKKFYTYKPSGPPNCL